MNPTKIALAVAGLLLLFVAGLALRGVTAPAVTAPTPIHSAPVPSAHAWPEVALTEHAGVRSGAVKSGAGPVAKPGQLVRIRFTGWLQSTEIAFAPATRLQTTAILGRGDVVPGLEAALGQMRQGEQRVVFVPSALGYGQTGKPPSVPSNADLVYLVTLENLEDPREVPSSPPVGAADLEVDGVAYAVLTPGQGLPPKAGDQVEIHFTAWLEDGTLVVSSIEQQKPITITLGKNEVFAGLDAAVATMTTGERRKLVVPPELAAGEKGRGPIPPNATLLFEVELVAIK